MRWWFRRRFGLREENMRNCAVVALPYAGLIAAFLALFESWVVVVGGALAITALAVVTYKWGWDDARRVVVHLPQPPGEEEERPLPGVGFVGEPGLLAAGVDPPVTDQEYPKRDDRSECSSGYCGWDPRVGEPHTCPEKAGQV